MKNAKRNLIGCLLAVTAIAVLTGCGASKIPHAVQESSLSSEDISLDTNVNVDVGSQARCVEFNHATPGDKDLKGFITSYSSYSGVDRSKLRFVIKEVPAGVIDGSQFINVFGLYVNQYSSLQSTAAMGFAFIRRTTGVMYNLSNPVKALTKTTIQEQFINANYLQNSMSVEAFFNQAVLVLVGVSTETQAVKIQLYNSSNSQAVTSPMMQIVPSKYLSANPYRYHYNTSHYTLAHMHPYTDDMIDISINEAMQEDSTFYAKSEQVCQKSL